MTKFLFLLFLFILLYSCSVTKRVHQKGYHIKWKNTLNNCITDKARESLIVYEDPQVFQDEKLEAVKRSDEKGITPLSSNLLEIESMSPNESSSLIQPNGNDETIFRHDALQIEQRNIIETPIYDNIEPIESKQNRRFPLVLFILLTIVLLVPFSIITGFAGYILWGLIALIVGSALITEILFWFIAVLFISLAFFWLSYLLYSLIYSDDPFYENKQSKFKRDFWKLISTIYLTFLLLLGLVLFV